MVSRPIETEVVVGQRRPGTPSLATLVPLILILMTITGAVYPAIDLTAGERERGTLETLIASPVPRMQLLSAKYAAVVTVALLTAVVNLAAMLATVSSIGLGTVLFGEAGVSLRRHAEIVAPAGAVRGVLLGRAAGRHELRPQLQGGAGLLDSADAGLDHARHALDDSRAQAARAAGGDAPA